MPQDDEIESRLKSVSENRPPQPDSSVFPEGNPRRVGVHDRINVVAVYSQTPSQNTRRNRRRPPGRT